jgi:TonB family protein
MIAKQVRCLDDGKIRMELRVLGLDALTNPQAELFRRPNKAKETTNCLGIIKPPMALKADDSSPFVTGALSLRLIVGKDGRPKGIEVVRHGDKSSEQLALSSVRQWMFKPATCDGQPIEVQITVDLQSSLF